jgi:hypothetical protein
MARTVFAEPVGLYIRLGIIENHHHANFLKHLKRKAALAAAR